MTENRCRSVFLGLILDDELVRSEFESLMAAEFPQRPRLGPGCAVDVHGLPTAGLVPGPALERTRSYRDVAATRPARQRAPPLRERR